MSDTFRFVSKKLSPAPLSSPSHHSRLRSALSSHHSRHPLSSLQSPAHKLSSPGIQSRHHRLPGSPPGTGLLLTLPVVGLLSLLPRPLSACLTHSLCCPRHSAPVEDRSLALSLLRHHAAGRHPLPPHQQPGRPPSRRRPGTSKPSLGLVTWSGGSVASNQAGGLLLCLLWKHDQQRSTRL